MLESYAIGLAVVVGLTVAWVAVQAAWLAVFADASDGADALACRPGCGGCRKRSCEGADACAAHRAEEAIR